jgi:hypothetical protein
MNALDFLSMKGNKRDREEGCGEIGEDWEAKVIY